MAQLVCKGALLFLKNYLKRSIIIAASTLVLVMPDPGGKVAQAATPKICSVGPSGSTGPVQRPVLRATLPGSWDENWLASPAVADIDGDGRPEIIAARHSVLYVWRNDGTLYWKTAFGYSAANSPEHGTTRMWPSPVVGDLDGDGKMEIAVAGGIESKLGINLCLYDYSGQLRPGWPVKFGNYEVRSIAAADVNGDGVFEILVNKTGPGPATAVYRLNGTLLSNWPQVNASCNPPAPAEACWDFGGYNQNIGAGDLDGDGIDDVISTYDAIGFGVFWGDGKPFPTAPEFTDRVITAVEAYHDLALSLQGWGNGDRSEFTSSPPVVADLLDNGNMKIILAGDHEHTQSTKNRGTEVWVLNRDLTRPSGWEWPKDTGMPLGGSGNLGANIVPTMPSPSVADLDGTTGLEILVPGYDGILHAFMPDGTVYWTYAFSTVATPYTGASEALIADLNADGVPEVIFTTFSSGSPGVPNKTPNLIILSNTGVLLHKVPIAGRGSMAAPAIADIDGDGRPEIIISPKDAVGGGLGGVQIWDVPGAGTNCLLWETGRGGLLRQGSYRQRVNTPVVTTAAITDITPTSATGGGNVTSAGNSDVTARGVCWSTSAYPGISGTCTNDGIGTGDYSSALTGLSQSTLYHVRAYATNADGTGYGSVVNFTTSGPTISVTSPNSGESFIAGNVVPITWSYAGNAGANVKIKLYKGATLSRSITASTPLSNRSFNWTIPSTQLPGSNYNIRITSTTNTKVLDTTDMPFAITAPTISVTAPNSGESFIAGNVVPITWSYTGNAGANVKIELYKGATLSRSITASTPLSNRSFNWTIPSTQLPGSNYNIRITSTTNTKVLDTTDMPFAITAPTISVTAPNSGESFIAGNVVPITWSYTGNAGANVKIELYKGATLSRSITASTPLSNRSFNWTIPSTQAPGSNYNIRITSTTNTKVLDTTDMPFAITAPGTFKRGV